MSRKDAIATLMGLAPKAPRSFEHATPPAPPSPKDYIGKLEPQAARFQYVQEGDQTSLVQAAYGLAEWFSDTHGEEHLDADEWFDEAREGVLLLHPETNRAELTQVVRQLVLALEQFGAAYHQYALAESAWQVKRELVWRRQWAERIYSAAPEDESVEVAS